MSTEKGRKKGGGGGGNPKNLFTSGTVFTEKKKSIRGKRGEPKKRTSKKGNERGQEGACGLQVSGKRLDGRRRRKKIPGKKPQKRPRRGSKQKGVLRMTLETRLG